MDPENCDACGKAKHKGKDLLNCSRCKQAFYHDKVCQKKHWSKHKTLCRDLLLRKQEEDEQQRHVQVFDDENNKGRVISALKDFAPGDRVFIESPAILFDTQLEYYGLLEAFVDATQATQAKVLDLCSPPLSEINSAGRQQRHAHLERQRQRYLSAHPENGSVVTVDITQKLLAIIETNAHQLFNANFGGFSSNNSVDPNRWMGLFVLGSMPEHSCNPNMTMNTTHDGKLELIAETYVAKGERLSFSYIEGIYERNRDERQAQLLREKHFFCQCSRCQSVDECRPFLLMNEEKDTPSLESYSNCEVCGNCHPYFWHVGTQQYICIMTPAPNNLVKKNPTNTSRVKKFTRIEGVLVITFRQLENSLPDGPLTIEEVLSKLVDLMTGTPWQTTIHPLHWLQISIYHFLSMTTAVMARMPPNEDDETGHQPQQASSLLRLSVLALLHNVVWTETTVRMLRSPAATTASTEPSSSYTGLQNALVTMKDENNILVSIRRALQGSLSVAATNGSFDVAESELKSIIERIVEQPGVALDDAEDAAQFTTTADALLTVFHAGKDLILAGHVDLCLQLYQRYQAWFHKLKQPSDDNRARIDLFLSSQGRIMPFEDDDGDIM